MKKRKSPSRVLLALATSLSLFSSGLMLSSSTWSDGERGQKSFSSGAKIVSGKRQNTERFTPPSWVTERNNVMYEMNVFRTPSMSGDETGGTFRAAKEHLPRLAEMGISIVWLQPVYELATNIHLKADFPSLYQVKDHKKLDPRLGSMRDARAFVRHAHSLGIRVLFDLVPTHTSFDSPLIEEHPEWYSRNSEGEIINGAALRFNSFFWDIANLDPDNVDVQNYAVNVIRHWVRELNIDGYRVDGGRRALSTEFWNRARRACDRAKGRDGCFFIGETFSHEASSGYSRFFDAFTARPLKNTLTSFTSAQNVHQQLAYEQLNYAIGAIPVRATANHDDVGTITADQVWGANYFAGITLMYTMQGLPMIVQGEDGGNLSRINLFDDTPIDNDFDSLTTQFLTRMGEIREENSALHNVALKDGQHFFQLNNNNANNPNVYAFMRFNKDNRVIVLVNLTNQPQTFSYSQGVTGIWTQDGDQRDIVVPGTYENALYPEFDSSDATLEISEARGTFATAQPNFTVQIPANGYKIFTDTDGSNEFVRQAVDIDEFVPRWTYMAVRSSAPSLDELCNIEGCPGFADYVADNSEQIEALLDDNVRTFFVKAGDSLSEGFDIADVSAEGLLYTSTAIGNFCGFFDNPGSSFGVPNQISVLDPFGSTGETISGKSIVLRQDKLFGNPFCDEPPFIDIDGDDNQVIIGNRTFVYTDSNGVEKYGLLHLLEN